MTIEEAKEFMPDFNSFHAEACRYCNHDWFCPDYCDTLRKASKMDFERIQKSYARNDGDMVKVINFIRQARI